MPNLSLLILEGKRFILIRRTEQNYFFTWMKIRKKSFNQNNMHFSQFYINVEFKFVFQFLKGSPCIILLYLHTNMSKYLLKIRKVQFSTQKGIIFVPFKLFKYWILGIFLCFLQIFLKLQICVNRLYCRHFCLYIVYIHMIS